jgi:hypothetical protein
MWLAVCTHSRRPEAHAEGLCRRTIRAGTPTAVSPAGSKPITTGPGADDSVVADLEIRDHRRPHADLHPGTDLDPAEIDPRPEGANAPMIRQSRATVG